jgi:deoxyribodipyrimidine photo-lyase
MIPTINRCVWLREDLRLLDHQGFLKAQESAQETPDQQSKILALYIMTPETWRSHDRSAVQIHLILSKLRELSQALAKFHIPLKILNLKSFDEIPAALKKFCRHYGIQEIYASKYYGYDEIRRDTLVQKALNEIGVNVFFRHGFVVFKPTDILKSDGTPYQVFTPYKRAWIQKFLASQFFEAVQENVEKSEKIALKAQDFWESSDPIPENLAGFEDKNLIHEKFVLSEKALHQKLKKFLQASVLHYQEDRDFPAKSMGTSQLSPYLAQGMISPKQILKALMLEYLEDSRGDFLKLLAKPGIETFVGELIWRDFYQMVLYHFPRVSKHQPFKLKTKKIPWASGAHAEKLFQAWCEGNTGFPIIDAAMRCLNQTGFMHNRLRMITAMFLSKLLLLDWRWGEAYFMKHLVDGELGANNGGWQWCASTGTDAVPYFRIFNPTAQSQKFDPEGVFIRQYLPELDQAVHQGLPLKNIHCPDLLARKKCGYPEPIIDYASQRQKALKLFAV